MKHPRQKAAAPPSLWEGLKARASEMRTQPTRAEERLWQALRGKRVAALKFRRQHAIGPYIVDFYCFSAQLVIEVDGPIHHEQQEPDQMRQAHLEALGLRVLRFSNDDVLNETSKVVEQIEKFATGSED